MPKSRFGRRPRPPAFAYGAKPQRWSVVLQPGETGPAVVQDLKAGQWAFVEAVSVEGIKLRASLGPVAVWFWMDGRWVWIAGPVDPDVTLPAAPAGVAVGLLAIGDASVNILFQQEDDEEGEEEGGNNNEEHPIEWPGLDPPAITNSCTHRVTNGINGQDCDVPFSTRASRCSEIHYVVEPGSVWTTAAGQRAIADELQRCQAWWARYCIYLTFTPITLPAADRAKLRQDSFVWRQAYPRDTNASTGQFHDLTYWLYGECRSSVRRAARRNFKVVMFFERCASWRSGGAGQQGHNRNQLVRPSRATPGSATVIGRDAIIIHGVEVRSQHIVTHELIHQLGRPAGNPFAQAQASWNHRSACQNSMSTAPARGMVPFSFEDSRLLDIVEYTEIRNSGHLRRC